jgi:hypothetical protein
MRRASILIAAAAFGAASFILPASPARAADTSSKVQYKDIERADMPKEARHAADEQTRGAKDVTYQSEIREGKTFYGLHYTDAKGKRMELRLDPSGKVVAGPNEARDKSTKGGSSSDKSGGGSSAANDDDAGVKFHHISDRDVSKEVPKDVLRTMDQYTKDGKDLYYQSQVRQDGKTYYSVHYTTKDNKRMFVRVADNGKLALGPQISDAKEANAANPDAGRRGTTPTASKSDGSVKRESITADDLPAPVRKTVEQQLANGGGHTFIRETKGRDVSYVVEYNLNNEHTSARIAPDGRMIQASPLASGQTTTPPNATPIPGAANPTPTPAVNQSDAQLAAAREAAAHAPYQVLSGVDQLPAEVRAAASKDLATATDPIVQRFTRNGQTVYGIHFTGPNGGRRFMAVDGSGKIVVDNKKSGWQEGGKNVKYAVVDGGSLPAPVRQHVETNGGSEQIFLSRTGPKGETTYLVQWTAANGERMETEINAEGKVTQKPRKAEDQPFAAAGERKKK